eukprot:CAMPEP_0185793008 /NCGR_PEP_ID=MMETSP1174-20130828/159235_1 /TAXON_ID=35687 /ORGANISM="Dictyocha speculum, Strain CCMP1381" /LENGTH=95 /DNA_ID=CAMNT_0028488111 /DNA_START=2627 /DNA_END=2909 /DNA_ORIENTATION=-
MKKSFDRFTGSSFGGGPSEFCRVSGGERPGRSVVRVIHGGGRIGSRRLPLPLLGKDFFSAELKEEEGEIEVGDSLSAQDGLEGRPDGGVKVVVPA